MLTSHLAFKHKHEHIHKHTQNVLKREKNKAFCKCLIVYTDWPQKEMVMYLYLLWGFTFVSLGTEDP